MKSTKTFLFFCRNSYDLIVTESSLGYGFYVGDGIDVAVCRSVEEGLKLVAKVDKLSDIDDGTTYERLGKGVSIEEFNCFVEMQQAGEVDKII